MDPLQVFDNFKLDTLDEEWANEIWRGDFLNFPEPPQEYSIMLGSEDMELLLKDACTAVKNWVVQNSNLKEDDRQKTEVSWQTLVALNINLRSLLAVLGFLMKVGQQVGADEDSRQACLAATSLYFTLLAIPGSNSFHVFHPNLYQRAIETLKLSEHLVTINKKNQRINNLESLYTEDQENDTLVYTEKLTLIKSLNSILFDLITMLKTFYMKYQVQSLEVTIMRLVETTKLETEFNHFQSNGKKMGASKTSLSYNAYVALQDLCHPRHGSIDDTIRLIARHLMPHLFPNNLDLPPKAMAVIWDTIIHFLSGILDSKGEAAELGIETLVQHLMAKAPERAEARQKQAGVVAKLINQCKGPVFQQSIRNVVLFSHHTKVAYRIFAQEVIGKLMLELNTSMSDLSDDEVLVRNKVKNVLIATTLSRCTDSSCTVRGKAMAVLEFNNSPDHVNIEHFLNVEEENKPFSTVDQILNAITTNSNPLPGSEVVISMLIDRVQDERVLVRRSAMHILENLVVTFPSLLDKVTPTIGRHCRDPALTVRREAIQVLTNLLQHYPEDSGVLEEWIRAVISRIFDVETKVQEKVLDSLKLLVLDKIKTSSDYDKNNELEKLPWKIINLLTKEKLRKNLSKACIMWIKSEIITNSLISKVQSHIENENSAEAWTLLVAFSENLKLKNMNKYFEDCTKLLSAKDFVSSLKLEVFRNSWCNMSNDILQKFQVNIFEGLCKFQVSLGSIGTCIDSLFGIIKHINKSNSDYLVEKHMLDLIKLSEAQIEKIDDDEQPVDGGRLYLKAMCTLGHAALFCTDNISPSTLNILQGLLLECDSFNTLNCTKELKAAGVVILGQEAMRNREIAEKVMPILGRLMCRSTDPGSSSEAAIRVNAVKALADLCIRFTALVEPYLPDMCICMKDPNPLVREVIVVIFVQLLLEDFIKVKGAFFFHILTMLSDNDETIRELTIFLVKERLLVKNKTLILQSFLGSIFHYNNCQTKHKFNDRRMRKKEKEALTLPGTKNQSKRRMIYNFMIEYLDPASKQKVIMKLTKDVLEGFCEDFININSDEGVCVLKDVLYILLNDRMQPTSNKVSEDDHLEDAPITESSANNAINNIAENVKKFKLDVLLHTAAKLKGHLQAHKSPLMKEVSKFILRIASDYNKDQLTGLYDEYPKIEKEMEMDIRKYGKKPQMDDDSDTDEDSDVPSGTKECHKTPSKPKSVKSSVRPRVISVQDNISEKIPIGGLHYGPKIVLRRISTLTYPGMGNWKSPPRESNINPQASEPGPSSSGMSSSSKSPTEYFSLSSADSSDEENGPASKRCRYSTPQAEFQDEITSLPTS